MYGKLKVLLGLSLMAAAPSAFAQYTVDLTGVGNGTVADGVYVSPYQGTITGNGVNYSGFMICDDFLHESFLNMPFSATMTSADNLDGSEKFGTPETFTFNGITYTYTAQQTYNAAGWLANNLLSSSNVNNPGSQVDYSFAIWDLFDGQQTDPNGGAQLLESQAFSAVSNGYVASNVSVFTPNPVNASQEFLVVRAPEIDPASAMSGLTLLLGGLAVARGRRSKQAA